MAKAIGRLAIALFFLWLLLAAGCERQQPGQNPQATPQQQTGSTGGVTFSGAIMRI